METVLSLRIRRGQEAVVLSPGEKGISLEQVTDRRTAITNNDKAFFICNLHGAGANLIIKTE